MGGSAPGALTSASPGDIWAKMKHVERMSWGAFVEWKDVRGDGRPWWTLQRARQGALPGPTPGVARRQPWRLGGREVIATNDVREHRE